MFAGAYRRCVTSKWLLEGAYRRLNYAYMLVYASITRNSSTHVHIVRSIETPRIYIKIQPLEWIQFNSDETVSNSLASFLRYWRSRFPIKSIGNNCYKKKRYAISDILKYSTVRNKSYIIRAGTPARKRVISGMQWCAASLPWIFSYNLLCRP